MKVVEATQAPQEEDYQVDQVKTPQVEGYDSAASSSSAHSAGKVRMVWWHHTVGDLPDTAEEKVVRRQVEGTVGSSDAVVGQGRDRAFHLAAQSQTVPLEAEPVDVRMESAVADMPAARTVAEMRSTPSLQVEEIAEVVGDMTEKRRPA